MDKSGFCKACIKNTPHHRYVQSAALRVIDKVTVPVTRWFGLGPWYCSNCHRRNLFIVKPRKDAATIDFQDSEGLDVERVGNFIRSDHSLVVRRARSSRYSQKYRDGVITRLISGNASISQLSRELNLSDRDLVDWIADLLIRRQEKIEELNRILNALQQNVSQERIGFDPASVANGDGVVDGNLQTP